MNNAAQALVENGCSDVLNSEEKNILSLDGELSQYFSGRIKVDKTLSRKIVSFQANKKNPIYRWYKYKEAFSADLVAKYLQEMGLSGAKVLDPFAGAGTTLFAASESGLEAHGIELLPIGQQIIRARKNLQSNNASNIVLDIENWLTNKPWINENSTQQINTLRITKGAYPPETELRISKFLNSLTELNPDSQQVLRFALLCVLESISFTRKDGQYLRWDSRANRSNGSKIFNKGEILSFDNAISSKLSEILEDTQRDGEVKDLFSSLNTTKLGPVNLFSGSCLNLMPTLTSNSYDAIITSPPYCNRYDYTRTYALELAILGVSEEELIQLRQDMLSCTVENREKELISQNPDWKTVTQTCDNLELLQAILSFLENKKALKELNNNGIPRMVRGYFYEMSCIIRECYRVLSNNGVMVMVNDNVRYAGLSISVDTILSKIAEEIGFQVESINVLPQNKGNSSQQMGAHGRQALRKSVYVWRKDK